MIKLVLFYRKPVGKGTGIGFTNMRSLADYDENLNYYTLVNHFTRRKLGWYADPYHGIEIYRVDKIVKGKQAAPKASQFKSRL